MSVEVRTVRDAELRVQVVDQRTSFDTDPDAFADTVQSNQDALQVKVVNAQERLNGVSIDDDLRLKISAVCGELDVDGLRGDIVTNRSTRQASNWNDCRCRISNRRNGSQYTISNLYQVSPMPIFQWYPISFYIFLLFFC